MNSGDKTGREAGDRSEEGQEEDKPEDPERIHDVALSARSAWLCALLVHRHTLIGRTTHLRSGENGEARWSDAPPPMAAFNGGGWRKGGGCTPGPPFSGP